MMVQKPIEFQNFRQSKWDEYDENAATLQMDLMGNWKRSNEKKNEKKIGTDMYENAFWQSKNVIHFKVYGKLQFSEICI